MTRWMGPMEPGRGARLWIAVLLIATVACDSEADGPSPVGTADATTGDGDAAALEGGMWSCHLSNPFSGSPECKSYTGGSWDRDSAMADCREGQYGEPGRFGSAPCDVGERMGVCDVPSYFGLEYQLVLGGTNADFCTATARACTNFLDGAFTAAPACEGAYVPPPVDGGFVFEWPTQTCVAPAPGAPPGASPGGEVCTWNLISGCTEPGRDYLKYGDCDVVRTNRPYYAVPPRPVGPADDPRLADETFVTESNWIREQVAACACVCCHTDRSPDGPSMWTIDDGPLFIDAMSDTAIAMFAGYIDSSAFGGFDPANNNGFNRLDSALPTTDVERTLAFFEREFQRREIDVDWARSQRAIGGPLVEQRAHVPEPCPSDTGIRADGVLEWPVEELARYVYVLRADAANPGMPPNLDLPEGTLWRIDLPHTESPIPSGSVRYGEVPPLMRQAFPADGAAPEPLVSGESYYLYILKDLAFPISRCIAVAP